MAAGSVGTEPFYCVSQREPHCHNRGLQQCDYCKWETARRELPKVLTKSPTVRGPLGEWYRALGRLYGIKGE